MKLPVAPESTREFKDLTSAVSVVSMLTLSFKDFGSSSVDAMTSLAGRLRSQRGRKTRAGSGFGMSLICSAGSSISGILSTDKIANLLYADGEGVLFTRRLWENPPSLTLVERGLWRPVLGRLRRTALICSLAVLAARLPRGSGHQNGPDTPC